ncbi:exonuclease SbcD [Pontibacillus chungwhensis BH030062]|uniref:Nuclease SbcCD subunit D n=1 Tax=Pontibacillus chungwhensis BH030062 TaxID=1385513 RepID=A0A0A2VHG8_9BACI|nr:exonuclease SbcCD subunit D [Pontibacillus chungwhensis]KGP93065.1 exonuclease SbcD [Pontibacillus chungwhensis BH030062]
MKIIHTADWHLGKLVHQLHMTEDQEYILDQFIELVKDEQPDVVIIAGDLYDRAVPPKEAVDLLNRTLITLIYDLNIPVLAISGNHDSPDRLNFGSQLFKRQQFYLQARLEDAWKPVRIPDEYGQVSFYLIPYIEPSEVRKELDDESVDTHQQAMEAIVKRIKEDQVADDRHVFVGHAFLAGGMESESEERLSMLGGAPYINAELFNDFSYVALGHLHQPQKVKNETIRYSGSLLKYSFSEANHKKGVTIVELDGSGVASIRQERLKPKRDMRVKEGYLHDLLKVNEEGMEDYLHIKLLDEGQILDPMGKLRKKFPNVLSLERVGLIGKAYTEQLSNVQERKQMSHMELFESFYKEVKGTDMDQDRRDAISTVINEIQEEERNQ